MTTPSLPGTSYSLRPGLAARLAACLRFSAKKEPTPGVAHSSENPDVLPDAPDPIAAILFALRTELAVERNRRRRAENSLLLARKQLSMFKGLLERIVLAWGHVPDSVKTPQYVIEARKGHKALKASQGSTSAEKAARITTLDTATLKVPNLT